MNISGTRLRSLPGTLVLVYWLSGLGPGAARADDFRGWEHYGGGLHGMQYSSLGQINTDNVHELEEAWRFRTGELGQGHREPFAFQANPILVEGRLYVPTGSAIVFALDPATGEQIWRYDPQIDRSKPHAEIANRGVTSWLDPLAGQDARCRHRIFVGTLDARLIALDGATGTPCEGFGEQGQGWLNKDVRAEPDSEWVNYTVTSPPVIVGDTVVVGSAIGDNRAVESELGIVRGIDARSGRERWRWDPIPRNESDPAYATWESGEAARNGSANAWAPLAADPELGLVYVPTGSASPEFYGGEREGDNLYAN
jgi:quinoprotein glucose dehydrogenase